LKSIKDHIKADLYLLGRTNPAVHSFLDSNVKYYGPAHRFDNHDYRTVRLLDSLWGKDAGDIAFLHILLDLNILNSDVVMQTTKQINTTIPITKRSL
jgi:hypothetical protein